ncbi:MAG: hypothetical protein JSS87_13450 [Acidobacteria bacterium]|nr:hypothetical protein [Acidobacteriota bacterium]
MQKLLLPIILLAPIAASAACAPTPVAAARAAFADVSSTGDEGFRATEATVDAATRRVWVRVIACGHPERPATLVPLNLPLVTTPSASPAANSSPIIPTVPHTIAIRAGEPVRLHFAQGNSRIELNGTAEQQGHIGESITIRIASALSEGPQSAPRRMKATITAPGEATLQP